MEEIEIEIDCLETQKQSIQLAIAHPFQYGRSPSDNEYLEIGPLIIELIQVQSKLDVLEETLESMKNNMAT